MNCTVHVRKDSCEVWVGNQAIPARTGRRGERLLANRWIRSWSTNQLIGGGFGRRLDVDGVVRAVEIAKHVDAPVEKIVDPRGSDIQHGMYRPYWVDRISAG